MSGKVTETFVGDGGMRTASLLTDIEIYRKRGEDQKYRC